MSTPFPLPRSPYPPGPLVTPEISQKAQTSPQPSTPMGTTQTILQQHGLAASRPATISASNPNALAPPAELSRQLQFLLAEGLRTLEDRGSAYFDQLDNALDPASNPSARVATQQTLLQSLQHILALVHSSGLGALPLLPPSSPVVPSDPSTLPPAAATSVLPPSLNELSDTLQTRMAETFAQRECLRRAVGVGADALKRGASGGPAGSGGGHRRVESERR